MIDRVRCCIWCVICGLEHCKRECGGSFLRCGLVYHWSTRSLEDGAVMRCTDWEYSGQMVKQPVLCKGGEIKMDLGAGLKGICTVVFRTDQGVYTSFIEIIQELIPTFIKRRNSSPQSKYAILHPHRKHDRLLRGRVTHPPLPHLSLFS